MNMDKKCIICGGVAVAKRKTPLPGMEGKCGVPEDGRPYYCEKHSAASDERIIIEEDTPCQKE